MERLSDEQLVKLANSGDDSSLDFLLKKYKRMANKMPAYCRILFSIYLYNPFNFLCIHGHLRRYWRARFFTLHFQKNILREWYSYLETVTLALNSYK